MLALVEEIGEVSTTVLKGEGRERFQAECLPQKPCYLCARVMTAMIRLDGTPVCVACCRREGI